MAKRKYTEASTITISCNHFAGRDYWDAALWPDEPVLVGVGYAETLVESISKHARSREACEAEARRKAAKKYGLSNPRIHYVL